MLGDGLPGAGSSNDETPPAVLKTHRALLPLFVALVVFSYLDRTVLSFAALQLCHEPWFNAKVYGLGSGIFYAGYVTAQVPSNLVLMRLGAKTWLPLITAAWGVTAAACAGFSSPTSFYVLRLLLGLSEAGAFPGMWAVCGQFYPARFITMPYSVIEASIAISQIIAAPLAAALLLLDGTAHLAGWQWQFICLGAATVLLAGVLRWRLPRSVAYAPFLNEQDKAWLAAQLAGDVAGVDQEEGGAGGGEAGGARGACTGGPECEGCGDGGGDERRGLQPAGALDSCGNGLGLAAGGRPALSARAQVALTLRNGWILYLMLLKALKDISLDALVYWVPTLVHALLLGGALSLAAPPAGADGEAKQCGDKASQLHAVLLSSLPFAATAAASLALGRSSERRDERHYHIGLPMLVGGAAFLVMPLLLGAGSMLPAFISVSVAVMAANATTGPFWAWVHMVARPGTSAVALASVNSVGKAGGMLGPLAFGLVRQATGSYLPAILLVGAALLAGGLLALAYRGERPGGYMRLAVSPAAPGPGPKRHVSDDGALELVRPGGR